MSETEWIDVPDSQTVRRFRYAEEAQILAVEFTSGAAYEYFDVPAHIAEQFKAAASKGLFLNEHLKGTYRYARL